MTTHNTKKRTKSMENEKISKIPLSHFPFVVKAITFAFFDPIHQIVIFDLVNLFSREKKKKKRFVQHHENNTPIAIVYFKFKNRRDNKEVVILFLSLKLLFLSLKKTSIIMLIIFF